MKLTNGAGYGALSCRIRAERNLPVLSELGYHVPADIVGYAVCRAFIHDSDLSEACSRCSYRMRLAKGRARKPRQEQITLPLRRLELPGAPLRGWARVTFSIDPEGVVIQRVTLLRRNPSSKR